MRPELEERLRRAVSGAVAQRWPETELDLDADGRALHVSWVDGPTREQVDEVVAPYATLTRTVRQEALGYEEVSGAERVVVLTRITSPRALALAASTQLQGREVGLPEEAVYAAAGLERESAGSPHPAAVRATLLLEAALADGTGWEGFELAEEVEEALEALELTDPAALLHGLDREEQERAECFAALAVDAGAETAEDVLLWGASGGWELTCRVLEGRAGRGRGRNGGGVPNKEEA